MPSALNCETAGHEIRPTSGATSLAAEGQDAFRNTGLQTDNNGDRQLMRKFGTIRWSVIAQPRKTTLLPDNAVRCWNTAGTRRPQLAAAIKVAGLQWCADQRARRSFGPTNVDVDPIPKFASCQLTTTPAAVEEGWRPKDRTSHQCALEVSSCSLIHASMPDPSQPSDQALNLFDAETQPRP